MPGTAGSADVVAQAQQSVEDDEDDLPESSEDEEEEALSAPPAPSSKKPPRAASPAITGPVASPSLSPPAKTDAAETITKQEGAASPQPSSKAPVVQQTPPAPTATPPPAGSSSSSSEPSTAIIVLPSMPRETGAVGEFVNMLLNWIEASGALNYLPHYHALLSSVQRVEAFFLERDATGAIAGVSPNVIGAATMQAEQDPAVAFDACVALAVYINLCEVLLMALVGSQSVLPVLFRGVVTYAMYYPVYWLVRHSASVQYALIGVIFACTLAASDLMKSFTVDGDHWTFFLSILYVAKAALGALIIASAFRIYRDLASALATGKPSAMV